MSYHEDQSTQVTENQAAPEQRDLIRTRACWWIWGVPVALAILNRGLQAAGLVPSVVTGLGWMAITFWIGGACFVNGRRCGRVHCRIDGITFPLLGLVALAKMAGVVPLSWSMYSNIFWAVAVVGFVPELFGFKYSGGRRC